MVFVFTEMQIGTSPDNSSPVTYKVQASEDFEITVDSQTVQIDNSQLYLTSYTVSFHILCYSLSVRSDSRIQFDSASYALPAVVTFLSDDKFIRVSDVMVMGRDSTDGRRGFEISGRKTVTVDPVTYVENNQVYLTDYFSNLLTDPLSNRLIE